MRVTAVWTGFSGAPGYTSFHFSTFTGGGDAQAAVDRVRAFFSGVRTFLPGSVSIQVQPTVEILDEASGVLQDYVDAEDPPLVVTGNGTGAYSAAAGAVISWNTATVANGRRVRGRTFLVPLSGSGLESDGTLSAAGLLEINAAAAGLEGGDFEQQLVVWSRPRNGAGGVAAPVTGHRVPDMTAVLRSRRD